ncbi:hypothetical protein AWH56_008795 [Anaerobacillus isosaccharinicus]|uniref:Uncharacterized protein n=1 Tax=Anaerobacillus isosaccharinicus TaxID=1532552 RepID=A0A1S2L1B4_9BACI|nr:hypothetical protein [Anaerobacillus isosaccharinicus]MBA5588930.1 hypothetical protein [Anaerobacillus isosaccharinicus]QOY37659.1 hypothetical protein AWH56_008795 [Anaerobacillus isosaccharinicus]
MIRIVKPIKDGLLFLIQLDYRKYIVGCVENMETIKKIENGFVPNGAKFFDFMEYAIDEFGSVYLKNQK